MESSDIIRMNIKTYDEKGYVIVRIKDFGVGIPQEQVSKIFEPFHTTKTKGTGLGLAITYKIFESHDAIVNVDSIVGQGTEFIIKIPIDQFMGSGQGQQHVAS